MLSLEIEIDANFKGVVNVIDWG